jgi:hypothetical protein
MSHRINEPRGNITNSRKYSTISQYAAHAHKHMIQAPILVKMHRQSWDTMRPHKVPQQVKQEHANSCTKF